MNRHNHDLMLQVVEDKGTYCTLVDLLVNNISSSHVISSYIYKCSRRREQQKMSVLCETAHVHMNNMSVT